MRMVSESQVRGGWSRRYDGVNSAALEE